MGPTYGWPRCSMTWCGPLRCGPQQVYTPPPPPAYVASPPAYVAPPPAYVAPQQQHTVGVGLSLERSDWVRPAAARALTLTPTRALWRPAARWRAVAQSRGRRVPGLVIAALPRPQVRSLQQRCRRVSDALLPGRRSSVPCAPPLMPAASLGSEASCGRGGARHGGSGVLQDTTTYVERIVPGFAAESSGRFQARLPGIAPTTTNITQHPLRFFSSTVLPLPKEDTNRKRAATRLRAHSQGATPLEGWDVLYNILVFVIQHKYCCVSKISVLHSLGFDVI